MRVAIVAVLVGVAGCGGGADASEAPGALVAGDAGDAGGDARGEAAADAPAACVADTDCPGTDGECRRRACIDGGCGVDTSPAGTLLRSQVAGDCTARVCDADGNVTTRVDSNDVAVTGNDCIVSTCPGPVSAPAADGAHCSDADGGALCLAGACVAFIPVKCRVSVDAGPTLYVDCDGKNHPWSAYVEGHRGPACPIVNGKYTAAYCKPGDACSVSTANGSLDGVCE